MTSGDHTERLAGRRAPRWYGILLLLCAGTAWHYGTQRPKGAAHWRGATMGTTYSVKLAVPVPANEHIRLGAALKRDLATVERAMSTWEEHSELSRFAKTPAGVPLRLSPSTVAVLQVALTVSAASGGAFDVTVGPMVDAWGFGPNGRPAGAPDEAALDTLRARVGYAKLVLDVPARTLTKTVEGVAVDLSGVAKGFAADLLAGRLEATGYTDYLVEVGGEMRIRGRNETQEPWRVAIRRPGGGALAVHPGTRGVATSSNDRNFYRRDGIRYVHTIDPRTARPVEHHLAGVSVIDETAALADAWATALLVLGEAEAWRIAKNNGLAVALFILDGNKVVTHMTPEFEILLAGSPQEG